MSPLRPTCALKCLGLHLPWLGFLLFPGTFPPSSPPCTRLEVTHLLFLFVHTFHQKLHLPFIYQNVPLIHTRSFFLDTAPTVPPPCSLAHLSRANLSAPGGGALRPPAHVASSSLSTLPSWGVWSWDLSGFLGSFISV